MGRQLDEARSSTQAGRPGGRAWLQLLDGFQLKLDGKPVSLPVSGQRLLAFLSIRGLSPRAVVAGTLWPDVTDHNAQGSLRTTIWRLHRGGTRLIESSPAGLALTRDISVDSRVFAEGARCVIRTPGLFDDTAASEGLMADAIAGGELLPGWYDDWVIFERERLRQLRLHTLEAFAERLTTQRRYASALEIALETVRIEPLRESAHRIVIAIHLAENNVVEALRHYRYFCDLLRSELGIEPSVQLTASMLPTRTCGVARFCAMRDAR